MTTILVNILLLFAIVVICIVTTMVVWTLNKLRKFFKDHAKDLKIDWTL